MANQLTRYATVASVRTADQGYFFGYTIATPGAGNTTLKVDSVNQVRVYQFVLPFRVVVRKVTFEVTTLDAGNFAAMGLYDADGNLVLTSGAITTAATGILVNAITAVTVEPGVYFLAFTADTTTAAFRALNPVGIFRDLTNDSATAKREGNAANVSSVAVFPATLGTVTADTGTNAPPGVLFSP